MSPAEDDNPPNEGKPNHEAGSPGNLESLIASGEGPTVEFKSSLRVEVDTGAVNRELTRVVVKTLAGFLNSGGGTLLIGVADNGDVLGIEADIESLTKKDEDGFELTLRTAVANFLGHATSPSLQVSFPRVGDHVIARVYCGGHYQPVFLQEGDKRDLFVRDGNLTKPLDIRSALEYTSVHWQDEAPITAEEIRSAIRDALDERLGAAGTPPLAARPESLPPWIRVGTRKVLDLFLGTLARSHGWKRIFIVSPWISDLGSDASLTFDQMLRRIKEDRTTAYVVTRPPEEGWHSRAIERLGETERANIALVPDLHMKLFTARTNVGAFALLGSANFTHKSLMNREIGVLVNGFSDGKRVVSELDMEASQVYRARGRNLLYKAKFS